MNCSRTASCIAWSFLALLIPLLTAAQNSPMSALETKALEKAKNAGALGLTSNAGNKYIRVYMSASDGRFTIGTADGRKLLFGFPNEASTSWATIRIDSTYYNTRNTTTSGYVPGAVGFPAGTASIDPADSSLVMKWTLTASNIDVTQRLTPVVGDSSGAIWIQYTFKNNDTKSHGVGTLLMFDTQVNTNDNALIQTSTAGVIVRDTTFLSPNIPSYWQAFEGTVSNPLLVSRATLFGAGLVAPDKLSIGYWGNFSSVLWDYVRIGSPFGDSAVLMQWALRTLAPGASITIATMYGTGSVTVTAGLLSLNLSGPSALSVSNNALTPNPFDIILNVQNTGTASANNVSATLNLPTGLTLASGTATKAVNPSTLTAGGSGIVTWSVNASNAVKTAGDTLQYSVSTTATGLQSFSIGRKVFIPYIAPAATMSLIYNQIDANSFPVIKSYVTVNSSGGTPISGLTASNFVVKEDGTTESPVTVVPVGGSGSNVSVMLAIDKSGSMAGTPLSDAKTAASTFVNLLQTGDKAAVISFDDVVTLVQGFTSDKTILSSAINGIVAGNNTAIYDALYESVNQTRLQLGRKAIILMTDGQNNSGTHTLTDAVAYANQYSIPVFCIGLGSSADATLQQIASQTGGAYYAAPTSADLARIYQSISQQLANQYLITYTTHNPAKNGTVRTVNIAVNYNSQTDNKSKQYTAPNTSAIASIAPSASASVPAGTPFFVDVRVGDQTAVTDLSSIVFKLVSSSTLCSYVSGSAVAGTFLGTSPITAFQMVDAQTVSMGVTKTATPGVNGAGVVARAQFIVPSSTTSFGVTFSITDVIATNSAGGPVQFSPSTFSVTITPGSGSTSAQVWPGDCDNNGTVNASDVLPLGIYYGQTRPGANNPGNQWLAYTRTYWTSEPPGKKVYADADGSGTIDAADILPIGLNYGKTHTVTTNSIEPAVAAVKSNSVQQVDGTISIGTATRRSASSRVTVPVLLRTSRPVYGIAFTAKYSVPGAALLSRPTVRYVALDTGATVMGDALMMSRALDSEGILEVGMTQTRSTAGVGSGQLMNLSFDLTERSASELVVEIVEIMANDAGGNALVIAGGVFRSTLTAVETGTQMPASYNLSQNFPNPFNPSTTITYVVPEESQVRLVVFDMLGRQVRTLVETTKSPGTYSIVWDGKDVQGQVAESGVYFYRMTATSSSGKLVTESRRMILMK